MEIIREFKMFKDWIEKGKNLFKDGPRKKVLWNTYEYKGITIYKDKTIKANYDDMIDRILEDLVGKWNLVGNSIELYNKTNLMSANYGKITYTTTLRCRLSDVVTTSDETGHSSMPLDIKRGLIRDFKKCIGSGYHIDVEEFDDRGYVLFNVVIALNQ